MDKIKLLLVDDHQIVLDGLEAFLKEEPGMEIAGKAQSGQEALDFVKSNAVDMLILDVSMPPGMDGFETAKQIFKQKPSTKIILLTMYSDGNFVLQALQNGIHGFVVKEKSKESLVTAINSVQNGVRYYPFELLDKLKEDLKPKSGIPIQITKREVEVICMMVQNPSLTARDISEKMCIAKVTVEKHIQNLKSKLDLHRNVELIMYAIEHKLCDLK